MTPKERSARFANTLGKEGNYYTMVPDSLLKNLDILDLSFSEVGFLITLMTYAPKKKTLNTNSRQIFVSLSTIAQHTPHSERNLSRIKTKLIDKNYIWVENTKRKTDSLILTPLFSQLDFIMEIGKKYESRKVIMELFDKYRLEHGYSKLTRGKRSKKQTKKKNEIYTYELPNLQK